MTNDELLDKATRFVIGKCVLLNLYFDLPGCQDRWQVHTMKPEGWMMLDKCLGRDLTRDKAVELAMREGM